MVRKYKGSREEYEQKLGRVMGRLGVRVYEASQICDVHCAQNAELKFKEVEEMNEIIVKTQEELDNVPMDYHGRIIIKFGTWLNPAILRKSYDNASAVLRDNARAELWDNASAELQGNASAELWGNASAELWDNASAVLQGNASAVLQGNASAELRGNASAVLQGNASAELRDNARAEASGNTQIVDDCRSGRASVFGNARVVYLPQTLEEFISHYGIKGDGEITLYKAVHKHNEQYFSDYDDEFEYRIGEIAVPDNGFDDDAHEKCGAGINMAPLHWCLDYGRGWDDLAILEMTALREDVVVPINTDGKVRARKAKVIREVPLSECGIYGEILAKRRGVNDD